MKMKELLSDPARWTKGVFARNRFGDRVPVDSPSAHAFCLAGAIYVCYPNCVHREAVSVRLHRAIAEHSGETNYPSYAAFNDRPETTHEDIKAVLEKADV